MLRDILETEHDDGEAFLVSGRNAAPPDSIVRLESLGECGNQGNAYNRLRHYQRAHGIHDNNNLHRVQDFLLWSFNVLQ